MKHTVHCKPDSNQPQQDQQHLGPRRHGFPAAEALHQQLQQTDDRKRHYHQSADGKATAGADMVPSTPQSIYGMA